MCCASNGDPVLPATLWLPCCRAWIMAIRYSSWVRDAAPCTRFISAEGRRTIAMSSVTPSQRTWRGYCCTRLCALGSFPLTAGCCSGFRQRGVHRLIYDLVESTAMRGGARAAAFQLQYGYDPNSKGLHCSHPYLPTMQSAKYSFAVGGFDQISPQHFVVTIERCKWTKSAIVLLFILYWKHWTPSALARKMLSNR